VDLVTDPTSLRVALVQEAADLDPEVNRARLRDLGDLVPAGTELVVLPEAFARDFGESGSDLSAHAEPLGGPFDRALTAAAGPGTTVVAGMFETSPDPRRPFNTLLVRGAATAAYRKIHLYDSFGYRESDAVHPGAPAPVCVDIGGFRVGLMTCYDLRFPELARALVTDGAEVLLVPAAWVAGPRKVDHWRTLLRARAIENLAYVVAAAQPGPRYSGHSMVVDPWGETLAEAGEEAAMVGATLEREVLETARSTNPSLANRRLVTG
jgi:deaminated glutathione amidase